MAWRTAAAGSKAQHDEVCYEHPAKGPDHCSLCASYIPGSPPSCKGVVGPISAEDWCERFFLKPL